MINKITPHGGGGGGGRVTTSTPGFLSSTSHRNPILQQCVTISKKKKLYKMVESPT